MVGDAGCDIFLWVGKIVGFLGMSLVGEPCFLTSLLKGGGIKREKNHQSTENLPACKAHKSAICRTLLSPQHKKLVKNSQRKSQLTGRVLAVPATKTPLSPVTKEDTIN